jgi:hypothetical protein
MAIVTRTSESSGPPGVPTSVLTRTVPREFVGAPFESGVPIVKLPDDWAGGVHEPSGLESLPGKSGGPCTRFGLAHRLYAGTSEKLSGLAPSGRG